MVIAPGMEPLVVSFFEILYSLLSLCYYLDATVFIYHIHFNANNLSVLLPMCQKFIGPAKNRCCMFQMNPSLLSKIYVEYRGN